MANPSQPKLIESKLRGSSLNQVISPNSKELELVLSAGGAQGAWQDLEPVFASMSGGWLKASGARAGYLDTVATFKNYGTHPNDGVQGTANSQPVCLAHSGRNYLHLPGVAANRASVPDSVELSITGDISIEIEGRFTLPLASSMDLVAKSQSAVQISWMFGMDSVGQPFFIFSPDGTVGSGIIVNATADITTSHTDVTRLRIVRSGGAYSFFIETNGGGFTQIGATVNSSAAAIFDSTSEVSVGPTLFGNSGNLRGSIQTAKIWNTATPDISAPVLDIDFSTFADRATSGVAATGQTVTIHSSGGNPAVLVGRPLLYFDGVDDFFGVSGLVMPALSTFVYVIKPTDKALSLTWNNGGSSYTMVSTGGDVASPEDFEASSWNYRLNSVDLGALSRDGVYDNFSSVRSLAVTTATRVVTESIDLKFSGYPAGYMFQGYVEALYVYDRILDAGEIAKLETYLMNRYGI